MDKKTAKSDTNNIEQRVQKKSEKDRNSVIGGLVSISMQ